MEISDGYSVFKQISPLEPHAYENQALRLLDIQADHFNRLSDSGALQKAYNILTPQQTQRVNEMPLTIGRYQQFAFVYRRMIERSFDPDIFHFGIAFLHTDISTMSNGVAPSAYYEVPVGDSIYGSITRHNTDEFSEHDLWLVYTMVEEITVAQQSDTLPDVKYNLSGIVENNNTWHPPLILPQ